MRPRTEAPASGEPESERGTSLAPSRRESQASGSAGPIATAPVSGPPAWPNLQSHLDDLPHSLREHFRRAGNIAAKDMKEAYGIFTCFMSQTVEEDDLPGKKVLKSINFDTASPEVQEGLRAARKKEWGKFESFAAAIPIVGQQKADLLSEGHVVIPSKWVDVDKAEHRKGQADYAPEWKSRLVSCGNFEFAEGLRSDSPTADTDIHLLICTWASCHGVRLHSADVASAYFQGKPLDRVVLMSQPRGGLPGVDPEALLLIRVPIYGLTDSGRGFWVRLDGDAKECGLKASMIYPALYYLPGNDGSCVALLATHVDDLLFTYLPEGEEAIMKFLQKFELGSQEVDNFRYCGKQFSRELDGTITIDVADNTRKIRGIKFGASRKGNEVLDKDDLTRLRSTTGSLAWVVRQGRPDLAYRVSRLQSSVKGATVATLAEANRVVDLAHFHMNDVKLRFPPYHLNWDKLAIMTITDASFAGEADHKSQQGRVHFVIDHDEAKNDHCNSYRALILAFSSTTIRRVCRSTLQAETYSLQNGLESGDKLRGVLAELKGSIRSLKSWETDAREAIAHLALTDCRSLADHLDQEIPARTTDKRLGIELSAIHAGLWVDGRRTWHTMIGGDKLEWISTHTMAADCLTKSIKPDLLLRILRECLIRIDKDRTKSRKRQSGT